MTKKIFKELVIWLYENYKYMKLKDLKNKEGNWVFSKNVVYPSKGKGVIMVVSFKEYNLKPWQRVK